MIVICERDGAQIRINVMVCVYSCPVATKLKCKSYIENYEKIKALLIEQKYLTKYGPPNFVDPHTKIKKKIKEDIIEVVKEVEEEKPIPVMLKPKRKRRTKAEMEAFRNAEKERSN